VAEDDQNREATKRLREATARLQATIERAQEYDSRERLDAVVDRLSRKYLPPRRPDLRVIRGGRED
jgi:hypothetical protein